MSNVVKRVQVQTRPAVRVDSDWDATDAVQPYDPYWAQQQYADPRYIHIGGQQQTGLSPMGLFARSLQNVFQMQMTMMRDLDARVDHLEHLRRNESNVGQFYAQAWWALWGILMLILGTALVVVLLLIFKV